jgi:hypothetical protein
MTPIEIEVALHYHYSALSFPTHRQSISVDKAHSQLVDAGLLAFEDGFHRGFPEPLYVYVEALKAVPLPIQRRRMVWVMP